VGRDEVTIEEYGEPRAALRPLFELADESAAQIDSYLELGRVLVARDGSGAIVGHLLLVPAGDAVELKSLAVLEDRRRRGIGRELVERAVSICRDEGVRLLTVTTATAGLEVIGFYQRCGFRAASIERDVFTESRGYPLGLEEAGIPIRDAITFTLDLDPSVS
jgi:GNAT superfamily N-acetyltransferase